MVEQTAYGEAHKHFAALRAEAKAYSRPRKYYVYALVDPRRDLPFYIGKGKGRRALSHMRNFRKLAESNERKKAIIAELVEAGLEPEVLILRDNLQEHAALDMERELTLDFRGFVTNMWTARDSIGEQRRWGQASLLRMKTEEEYCAQHADQAEQARIIHRWFKRTLEDIAENGCPSNVRIKNHYRNGRYVGQDVDIW